MLGLGARVCVCVGGGGGKGFDSVLAMLIAFINF